MKKIIVSFMVSIALMITAISVDASTTKVIEKETYKEVKELIPQPRMKSVAVLDKEYGETDGFIEIWNEEWMNLTYSYGWEFDYSYDTGWVWHQGFLYWTRTIDYYYKTW